MYRILDRSIILLLYNWAQAKDLPFQYRIQVRTKIIGLYALSVQAVDPTYFLYQIAYYNSSYGIVKFSESDNEMILGVNIKWLFNSNYRRCLK